MARSLIPSLTALVVLLAIGTMSRAQESGKTAYRYDRAGRLVGVDYPNGKSINFKYDAAGNLLGRTLSEGGGAGAWHIGVKKPSAGAWYLTVGGDGTVSGHGADAARGFYTLAGTLTLAGKEATGTIRLVPEGGGADLASFVLLKSKVKTTIGETIFAAGGGKGICAISGGITGRLMRDPKGKEYGTLEWGGATHLVTSKLKDGASSVKAKSAKGAAVKLQVTLKK